MTGGRSFFCVKKLQHCRWIKKQCLNWNSFRVGTLIYISKIKLVIKKDGLNMQSWWSVDWLDGTNFKIWLTRGEFIQGQVPIQSLQVTVCQFPSSKTNFLTSSPLLLLFLIGGAPSKATWQKTECLFVIL